jgi:hypothetical protein
MMKKLEFSKGWKSAHGENNGINPWFGLVPKMEVKNTWLHASFYQEFGV